MICRVHYLDPQGRPGTKEVIAPKEDARAVFLHIYPGYRVQRVVQVGQATQRTPRTDKVVQGAEHWHTRGKEERNNGEPRDLVDGRMTPANRTAFQAGWDEQQQYMQPATEDQRATTADILRRVREGLKANL